MAARKLLRDQYLCLAVDCASQCTFKEVTGVQ